MRRISERSNRVVDENAFQLILEKIQSTSRFDSRNYKKSTLLRQIERRMSECGSRTLGEYLTAIETDRHEIERLVSKRPRHATAPLGGLGVPRSNVPAMTLHRHIVDSIPVPIVVTRLDGTVCAFNPAAEREWKKTERQTLGKKLASLRLPGLCGDHLSEKTAAVRAGSAEWAKADTAIVRSDGATLALCVDIVAVRTSTHAKVGLLYVTREVTAAHELETELARTKTEHRAVRDELRTSNEELDATSQELQAANEELETANEELRSTNQELEKLHQELQWARAKLEVHRAELAWHKEQVRLLALSAASVMHGLSAGIVVLDATGTIVLSNDAAGKLSGFSIGEAKGQLFWKLQIPGLGRSLLGRIRHALAKCLPFPGSEIAWGRWDGKKGSLRVAAIPILDDEVNLGSIIILKASSRASKLEKNFEPPERRAKAKNRGNRR